MAGNIFGADNSVSIVYANHQEGSIDNLTVAAGTTIAAFFASKNPGQAATSFKVRVNANSVLADYILQTGDKVTVTPVNIKGA